MKEETRSEKGAERLRGPGDNRHDGDHATATHDHDLLADLWWLAVPSVVLGLVS